MRFLPVLLVLWIVSVSAAVAGKLPMPTGEVILTITGDIKHTNIGDTAQFDEKMLHDLDWKKISTYTSFTHGLQKFAGPTLTSLLEAVGSRGGTIKAMALNDYFVEIPVSDADEHDVLVAREHNGKPMLIRDRGPLWVIYPLSESEADQQIYDTEMIWQLTLIEIIN